MPNHGRLLSYSEISNALTCQAQWDFRYSDALAGSSLKPKRVAPLLSAGRAWGASVAAYHKAFSSSVLVSPGQDAVDAMDESLNADADRQREFGVHDEQAHNELRTDLLLMLNHYIEIADEWPLDQETEREIIVPIPSRTGIRSSSRYKLQCFLDGTRERRDQPWLVEFKLRGTLTPVELIQLQRQLRWYAWAWWRETGVRPAGVEVHERLNEAPKPPRILKRGGGKPSHAKDQLCTADAYRATCEEYGVPMNAETFDSLARRKWQQVVPIIFRAGELEEAGRELVSAANMISKLDTGELFPVRNARPQNCRSCAFKEICPAPDNDLIDALYERTEPKRDRKPIKEEQTA